MASELGSSRTRPDSSINKASTKEVPLRMRFSKTPKSSLFDTKVKHSAILHTTNLSLVNSK